MIQALLHGKLSCDQENMEDILTSNVFGLLRYRVLADTLLRFLKKARRLDGQLLFPDGRQIMDYRFRFWPKLPATADSYGCEPDVEISLDLDNGLRYLLFVEAKFNSGKSSSDEPDDPSQQKAPEPPAERPYDQLVTEWRQVVFLAQQTRPQRQPILIYLTAHMIPPMEDLRESVRSANRTSTRVQRPFECYWLSWRHLRQIVDAQPDPLQRDLLALLDHLDLTFFAGFSRIGCPSWSWSFLAGPILRFHVGSEGFNGFSTLSTLPAAWSFGAPSFRFAGFTTPAISWRFSP